MGLAVGVIPPRIHAGVRYRLEWRRCMRGMLWVRRRSIGRPLTIWRLRWIVCLAIGSTIALCGRVLVWLRHFGHSSRIDSRLQLANPYHQRLDGECGRRARQAGRIMITGPALLSGGKSAACFQYQAGGEDSGRAGRVLVAAGHYRRPASDRRESTCSEKLCVTCCELLGQVRSPDSERERG